MNWLSITAAMICNVPFERYEHVRQIRFKRRRRLNLVSSLLVTYVQRLDQATDFGLPAGKVLDL